MKEIFSVSSGSTVAKAKPPVETKGEIATDEKAESKDFLSVMFSQIKNNAKNIKTDTQDIEKEFLTKEESIEVTIDENAPKKSLDNHLLEEVLEVISLLKNETPKSAFPKYSAKIEQFLNDESIKKEFKEVKNIADLMQLSKKLDLGLEKLSISKVDFEAIKKEFPNLGKKAFFEIPKEAEKEVKNTFADPTRKIELKSSEIPFNAIEKPTKKTEKEPSIFEKIITKNVKEDTKVSQDSKESVKDTKIENPKEVRVAETSKEAKVLETPKESIKTEIKKDIDIKAVEKEIKTVPQQNIKEVAKEAVSPIKEDKKTDFTLKAATNEDLEEVAIKESPKTTRVNEVKTEGETQKRGFAENMLEGLKNVKRETQKTSSSTLQTAQVSTEKVNSENTQAEAVDTKIDTNTTIKNETKVLKQEFIQKQVTTTRETWNTFANDLKEKLENYKPPIMKVQMALNPKGLGEVDVTVINRGNNLHVNITSNTNTMTLFTQNQAEFKNSLVNMGFTNLEMNFSDQRERSGEQTKNSSSNEDNNENYEELNEEEEISVELVVPQYV